MSGDLLDAVVRGVDDSDPSSRCSFDVDVVNANSIPPDHPPPRVSRDQFTIDRGEPDENAIRAGYHGDPFFRRARLRVLYLDPKRTRRPSLLVGIAEVRIENDEASASGLHSSPQPCAT